MEGSLIEKKTHNVLARMNNHGANLRIIYERNKNINVWTNNFFITFEQNPKQHIALNAQLLDISNSTHTWSKHAMVI